MRPFLVHLGFVTPVILTGAPPTLDAILLGELAIHLGDDEALKALPVAWRDGVPQASQMYIDGVNWHVGVPKVVRRADEFHTAPLGRLEPGRGGKFAFGNERKNTMETGYRAQAVRAACFIGVGDIDAIREIIRNDVVSIGKRRADGYGMVDKQALVVEEIDTDAATWGLMDGRGEPARPVPVATWADVGGVECMIQAVKARPFYWSTRVPVEPCAVPAHADAHLLLQGMPSA